jgi:hypothetical protein
MSRWTSTRFAASGTDIMVNLSRRDRRSPSSVDSIASTHPDLRDIEATSIRFTIRGTKTDNCKIVVQRIAPAYRESALRDS